VICISHRINTIEALQQLPKKYGVEIDLRDNLAGRIYLQHDPFISGDDFETYLQNYHHGLMILNIKSERVELKALELLTKYGITEYFFLDSSFPMVYLLSQQGNSNIALRVSEYEKMDTLIAMAGKVKWVWVDCFTKLPIGQDEISMLKALDYKLCLVSPELQGRPYDVEKMASEIKEQNLNFDAVCSKQYMMRIWEEKL